VNRLADETSPYLRQHATNPVDWFPWGADAFAQARAVDKPLFVSIGYASCHWCHVMAHESFEDPETADDLRRDFVSVKVDREERPDVDAVYMASVVASTGHGGWPMTVFCTPDGRPFYAGTYFPPTDRHGAPAFRRVLAALADAWRTRRREVEEQADALAAAVAREVRLTDHLEPTGPAGAPGTADAAVLQTAVGELSTLFDQEWGGFGAAPKFPRPAYVELCLRAPGGGPGSPNWQMATRTLDAMAAGGIYDHLAGGFARYSTDREWLVPHFEKMLTDQALLARTYLHAWRATGEGAYLQVASETLEFVLEDLASPAGGVCSSLDADAGGAEGSHATWTRAQVGDALAAAGRPDLTEAACAWYGVTDRGNWEGTTVLRRPVGAPLARPPEIEEARRLLADARRRRVQPALDDKVLTEWNAMTASVLAEGAMLTGSPRWALRAQGIAEMLFAELRRPADGRWLRSWQDGRAHHLAMAADLAWVVDCCTRLGELTGLAQWTARAVEAADQMLALFFEPPGTLHTTGSDADALIVRPRDVLDGALPAAGSVAAQALGRLAAVTGVTCYHDAAEGLVTAMAPILARSPSAVPDLALALGILQGPGEIVVAGDRPDLRDAVHRSWLPTAVVAWGEPVASPLWDGREPDRAYVCHHYTCMAPATDVDQLDAALRTLEVTGAGR